MQTFFLKLIMANKIYITEGWHTTNTVDFISIPFGVNCYKWKWKTSQKNDPKIFHLYSMYILHLQINGSANGTFQASKWSENYAQHLVFQVPS